MSNEDLFQLGIKGLIRNSKGEILLLKADPQLFAKKAEPHWDLPGGRIQKGDSVEETLVREVEEETGIKKILEVKPVNMVLSNIRFPIGDNIEVGLILAIYECKVEEDSQIKLSNEHTEFGWFEPVKASELLQIKYPKEFTDLIKKL